MRFHVAVTKSYRSFCFRRPTVSLCNTDIFANVMLHFLPFVSKGVFLLPQTQQRQWFKEILVLNQRERFRYKNFVSSDKL